jgi:hypothetical protein
MTTANGLVSRPHYLYRLYLPLRALRYFSGGFGGVNQAARRSSQVPAAATFRGDACAISNCVIMSSPSSAS